mgnify:CR=1 FL=1
MKYDHKQVEKKWQDIWDEKQCFHAENDSDKEKFYALVEFPYPSGQGLHVGHPRSYTALDIVARKKRMQGYNVLNPIGFDAFGLPAENAAIKHNTQAAAWTYKNMDQALATMKRMGFSYDLDRMVKTCSPDYYRWGQWIFEKMWEKGLVYRKKNPVNWCPNCKTVLANEQVTEGKCWRCGTEPEKRDLEQWYYKITEYSQELLDDLEKLPGWPERVKQMQANWIGRSEGAEVDFTLCDRDGEPIEGDEGKITVFTTRADTLFGVSFFVLAPEYARLHELVEGTEYEEAVTKIVEDSKHISAVERAQGTIEKHGAFTGRYVVNPVNGEKVPVWVADYVVADYGTGAVMAVPCGDQRDFEFARKYDLPIVPIILDDDDRAAVEASGETIDTFHAETVDWDCAHAAEGTLVQSGKYTGMRGGKHSEGEAAIVAALEEMGRGKRPVEFRLRDWLISRQRYWGEPFPIVYGEDGTPHLLPDSALPINLPDVPDYEPRTFDPMDAESNPEAPLSRNEDWVKVELDLGDGKKTYYRDTNTMPNWAGSCWYYMRYLDPTDTKHMVEKDEFDYWMGPNHNKYSGDEGGVDLYIGGVEHAVLHLLYSRFWHKVLFDLGYVDSAEPFHKLFNQGMIQAYAYTDDRGQYVPAAEVVEGPADANGEPTFTWNGQHANREFGKMGKSLKNIITPDDMYENYGADTFRLYEMGMGPLAESRPWNTRNVVGSMRFLQRLWRNVIDETTGEVRVTDGELDTKTLKLLNNTIADVTVEMEAMRPNTAIAKLIVLNNHLTSLDAVPRAAVEPLILMLSPIAPHICEELWSKLGHTESLAHADWPKADERYVGQDSVTAVVQIKGKVRAKLEVSPDIDPKELEKMALEAVADRLGGKEPRKVIVKAPKIVSIVPAE